MGKNVLDGYLYLQEANILLPIIYIVTLMPQYPTFHFKFMSNKKQWLES